MSKQRVLFLCTGNSARSQMAEAFLRKYGDGQFEPHTRGLVRLPMTPNLRILQNFPRFVSSAGKFVCRFNERDAVGGPKTE